MEDTLEGVSGATHLRDLQYGLNPCFNGRYPRGPIFYNLLAIRLLFRIFLTPNAVFCSKSVKYFNISLLLRYKILTRVTRIYLGKSSPIMDEKSGLGRDLTSKRIYV